MASFGSPKGNVLYLIACAAPLAAHLGPIVQTAQSAGWDVCVIATPAALAWIDLPGLEQLTGHIIRSEFRSRDDPEFVPLGDAVLACPASFNTLNKWAAGISDTLALGLLNEALGRQIPTVVVPWANEALRSHPAYKRSLDVLALPAITFLEAVPTEPNALAACACTALPLPG